MITVSEPAKQMLKSMLGAQGADPQTGLRLRRVKPRSYTLTVDKEAPGDQVVKHEGSKVLLVDKELADSLEGNTIGLADTAQGPTLIMLRTEEHPYKR